MKKHAAMDLAKAPYAPMYDANDPYSMLNLVSEQVKKSILAAQESHPHLFCLDETHLEKAIKKDYGKPSQTDNCIRYAFWREYDMAQFGGHQMRIQQIIKGICKTDYFYERYLKTPPLVAWMVTPPISYAIKAEETLTLGLDIFRRILMLPVKTGKNYDTRLMAIQVRIVDILDKRVHGGVVQRIHQHNTGSIGWDPANTALTKMTETISMEDIQERMKYLKGLTPKESIYDKSNEPSVPGPGVDETSGTGEGA